MHTPSRHAAAAARASALVCLLSGGAAEAQHVLEVGTGWGDMGDTPNALHWQPAYQGSRKDVPAYLGWRMMGESRVYWAPYARLNYVNYWSIGGGGNAFGATLAPLGLGVYLTRPPSAFSPEQRVGRWFVSFEVNLAAFQFGVNATPDGPPNPDVPSPTAYRAMLAQQVATTGHVQLDLLTAQQHYPGGAYSFARLSVPLRLQVWNHVTRRAGVGFFLDVIAAELEWSLQPGATREPALGYELTAGALAVLPGT